MKKKVRRGSPFQSELKKCVEEFVIFGEVVHVGPEVERALRLRFLVFAKEKDCATKIFAEGTANRAPR